jgi:hypothetical protein
MLQNENGPKAIFARLQARVAKKEGKPGSFADGFFCFYCMSIWLSVIPAIYLANSLIGVLGYTLAISAGAIIINTIVSEQEQ